MRACGEVTRLALAQPLQVRGALRVVLLQRRHHAVHRTALRLPRLQLRAQATLRRVARAAQACLQQGEAKRVNTGGHCFCVGWVRARAGAPRT